MTRWEHRRIEVIYRITVIIRFMCPTGLYHERQFVVNILSRDINDNKPLFVITGAYLDDITQFKAWPSSIIVYNGHIITGFPLKFENLGISFSAVDVILAGIGRSDFGKLVKAILILFFVIISGKRICAILLTGAFVFREILLVRTAIL